jgi:extradiol dioxygenase family protein
MASESSSPLEEFQGRPSFHLAFSVRDLEATRLFYVDVLGCRVGRSTPRWMDLNFFGYQITAHVVPDNGRQSLNEVDEHDIPIPHFGLIMDWEDWHRAVDHMTYIGVNFRVEPHVRFKGKVGEQATFFVEDPSGNCLEFKAFKEPSDVFGT